MRISLIHTIIAATLFFAFFSCRQESNRDDQQNEAYVENGIVKQYDDQNRLVAEVTFRNGVRNGVTKIYYASGALSDEMMYVDGEKNGISKKYHKNGNIYSLTPYVKGEKNGIQKKYYPNGDIWAETPYWQGQPGIGMKEYKRNGNLRENYPDVEVEKFVKKDHVILKFFLDNYSKNVVFYVTELIQDKYIPVMAKPLYAEEGSVRYEIPLPKTPLDTTISVVAKYQTNCYNIHVARKIYRLQVN